MSTVSDQASGGLSFGPFNLVAGERLLTRSGVPIDLGARALDILITLISTPNEVVSKKDLMSRVWPDVTVEEGSLRFHMASLRKALGDGKDGARYITTLAGRGYCFVAPVSRASSALERSHSSHGDGLLETGRKAAALVYSFEKFLLDTGTRELRRGRELLSVEPKVFDLLLYLIVNRERMVSKDDLIAGVWNGRIVSDAALTTCLNAARIAIGDSGEKQRLIKTLPRKGFRFVGAVSEGYRPSGPGSAIVSDNYVDASKSALTLPDRPSIAVLQFENMSGDPEQEYFADGVVEEITTALSRFKWLFVIDRNSSFTFKGSAVDIKEVGRKLGVRYVLEGSVRKASGKVRIAGQLIDAATGAHIWAERFERDLTDIFALQDEVTVAIVSAIQPKLLQTEIAIATRPRPENLTAYDFYLRAMQQYHLSTREGYTEAIRLAHRALELDPRFGLAAALAGNCHMLNVALGYAIDSQFDRNEAVRLLQLALSVDNGDPDTLARASAISSFLVGDSESAIEMADRAVALNPNSFTAWHARGMVYRNAGQPEEAVRSFELAIRMSPLDPTLHRAFVGTGWAFIELGRFDEAIVAGKKAQRQNPSHSATYLCLASAFAHLGRDAEARAAAARLLEVDPAFTISAFIARGGLSNAKLLIEGLRKAGLQE